MATQGLACLDSRALPGFQARERQFAALTDTQADLGSAPSVTTYVDTT
jgi:hypothetical protein